MSFNWLDYLKLADSLITQGASFAPEEACLRAATSRAYYSAFGITCEFVRNRGEIQLAKTGEDHRRIIDHFRGSSDRSRQRIGNRLDRIRVSRNKADYDSSSVVSVALATTSVQQAQEIADIIKTF